MEPDLNKIANIIADIQQSIKDRTDAQMNADRLEKELEDERNYIIDELANEQNLREELESYIEELAPTDKTLTHEYEF